MKVRRHTVKATRACDDWEDDYPPWYETGQSYELADESSRFRSVSPAAHRAMNTKPASSIGFHRPKA
jgi:hypothetical protein